MTDGKIKPSDDMLVGTREIADYARIDRSKVAEWINRYDFPAFVGVDGKYRSSKKAIDAWVQRCKTNKPCQ